MELTGQMVQKDHQDPKDPKDHQEQTVLTAPME